MALERRMFSVFMSVYILLQLRSEIEKQTPVIETSPQISMVPVRTRRSVSWRVGTRLSVFCVCVCVFVCVCEYTLRSTAECQ